MGVAKNLIPSMITAFHKCAFQKKHFQLIDYWKGPIMEGCCHGCGKELNPFNDYRLFLKQGNPILFAKLPSKNSVLFEKDVMISWGKYFYSMGLSSHPLQKFDFYINHLS